MVLLISAGRSPTRCLSSLKISLPKRKGESLPTINFQGRKYWFQGVYISSIFGWLPNLFAQRSGYGVLACGLALWMSLRVGEAFDLMKSLRQRWPTKPPLNCHFSTPISPTLHWSCGFMFGGCCFWLNFVDRLKPCRFLMYILFGVLCCSNCWVSICKTPI